MAPAPDKASPLAQLIAQLFNFATATWGAALSLPWRGPPRLDPTPASELLVKRNALRTRNRELSGLTATPSLPLSSNRRPRSPLLPRRSRRQPLRLLLLGLQALHSAPQRFTLFTLRHEVIPTLMTLMRHHRRRQVMPPFLLPFLLRLWAIQTSILRNGDAPAVVPVTV